MSSADSPSDDLLDEIATEVTERLRRGEQPRLEEYTSRYPHLSDLLSRILPAILALEATIPPQPSEPPTLSYQHGEFRLVKVVGRGAMGTVYEAEHVSLGRTVAVKVMHTEATPRTMELFRREARAAGRLQHPHAVPVYGVGEMEGKPFYVMRLITGAGFNQILTAARQARGLEPAMAVPESVDSIPISDHIPTVTRWMAEVTEAVAHAHELGVLHRDLKPANILIDDTRHAWVTDFGLAKLLDDSGSASADLVGTLRYMAPERFRGTNDQRCDVYALGVTLYEAVTLRQAFPQEDRLQLLDAIAKGAATPPRLVEPAVRRDLDTVIRKAMAPDPAHRYPTAGAFAADLRAILDDRPISARRPSAAEFAWRWCRRNPVVSALLTTVLIVTTSAAGLLYVQNLRLERAMQTAQESTRTAERKRLDQTISEARAVVRSRRPGQRLDALGRVTEAIALADRLDVRDEYTVSLRSAAAAAMALADVVTDPEWPGLIASSGTAVHPAAGLYVQPGPSHGEVRRLSDHSVIRIVPMNGESTAMFSPDGRYVVVSRPPTDANKRIVTRTDQPDAPIIELPLLGGLGFLPGTDRCAVVNSAGTLTVWDLTHGRPLSEHTIPGPSESRELCYDPTGQQGLLFSRDGARLILFEANTVTIVDQVTSAFHPTAATWHTDGKTLYVAGREGQPGQGRLKRFDTRTGRLALTGDWPVTEGFTSLSLNPAGDRLAAVGTSAVMILLDAHTGRMVASAPASRDGTWVHWHPDGQRLFGYVDGGQLRGWKVAEGREHSVLPETRVRDFSPVNGGQGVAIVGDGGLTVWQTTTGRTVTRPDLRATHVQSPTEKRLELWNGTTGSLVRVPLGLDEPTIGPAENVPVRKLSKLLGPGGQASRPFGMTMKGIVRETLGGAPREPVPDRPIFSSGDETVDKLRPFTRDGKTIVWLNRFSPGIVETPGGVTRPLGEGRHALAVISPDSRWGILVTHDSTAAELWDLSSATLVRKLYDQSGGTLPQFSPCGRWLWLGTDGGRLHRVGTWEPATVTGRGIGAPAFNPTGNLLAIETGTGTIRLVPTATGETIVELENPHRDPLNSLQFSLDGGRLFGLSQGQEPGVQIWDLALTRKHLSQLHLDWAD